MGELVAPPLTHSLDENPNVALPGNKKLEEGTKGRNTPKAKVIFDLPRGRDEVAQRKWVNANPFEALNGEENAFNFLKKALEALERGWIFQGKNKHKVRIELACPEVNHPSHIVALPGKTLGEKRGQKHSKFHHSFFDSLGIPLPKKIDYCKTRIWPIIMKEKGSLKEVLVHSKNQALPSLPIGIRMVGEGEEEWSPQPIMEELIKHVVASLEENVFKHQLPSKEAPNLEWNWREEPNMGGFECTILVHFPTGTNPVSIQSKKHLHSNALDRILVVNNETEFPTLARNLLLKKDLKARTANSIRI